MKKKIPKFNTEKEERRFWQQHDSAADYIDWDATEDVVLPRLKPSTRKISIRLPESMIEELKVLAGSITCFCQHRLQTGATSIFSRPLRSRRKDAKRLFV